MNSVRRWDLVTVGNLSRNRYWGEDEAEPVRPTLCTTTLITGEGFRLLVDPSCQEETRMAAELDRRTGLRLDDIDAVFVTHEHGDHHYGLHCFPHAQWLAAPAVAAAMNGSQQYTRRIEGIEVRLFGQVEVLATPGHTLNHHSLRFLCDGQVVVVAGDAVMTRDFWRDRQGFFNSVNLELAGRTIIRLSESADIVVPGHDNYFAVSRRG